MGKFLVYLCTFCFFAVLPMVVWSQKDVPPPALSLEDHDKIADLARQSLQVYIQKSQVQKKYDEQRDADPQWQNLTRQDNTIGAQLAEEVKKVSAKVDAAKWRFDPSTLTFVPVPPPAK